MPQTIGKITPEPTWGLQVDCENIKSGYCFRGLWWCIEIKENQLTGQIQEQTHYHVGNDNDYCQSFCHVMLFLCSEDLRFIVL